MWFWDIPFGISRWQKEVLVDNQAMFWKFSMHYVSSFPTILAKRAIHILCIEGAKLPLLLTNYSLFAANKNPSFPATMTAFFLYRTVPSNFEVPEKVLV